MFIETWIQKTFKLQRSETYSLHWKHLRASGAKELLGQT